VVDRSSELELAQRLVSALWFRRFMGSLEIFYVPLVKLAACQWTLPPSRNGSTSLN